MIDKKEVTKPEKIRKDYISFITAAFKDHSHNLRYMKTTEESFYSKYKVSSFEELSLEQVKLVSEILFSNLVINNSLVQRCDYVSMTNALNKIERF